jgi:dTMP kinase
MTRYRWIVLEGGDGAGKTSIRKHLYGAARQAGLEVLTVIQTSWLVPKHTEVITNARFHNHPYPRQEITAAYVGDKEAMTDKLITPHLTERHVVGDRFVMSDMVYHQVLWDIPTDDTYRAYARSRVRFPDLTLFIDTPPETAVERLMSRGTDRRNRWDNLETQRRVHSMFTHILDHRDRYSALGRIEVIDNSSDLNKTLVDVDQIVLPLLAP